MNTPKRPGSDERCPNTVDIEEMLDDMSFLDLPSQDNPNLSCQPVEQPPQTVAGELLAALQAMLVTFQYCIDNADLESVEQLVGKQARHAIEAATRHEGA